MTKGEVPGTLYGLSQNGWINSELFFHWFQHHFMEYAPPTRPLLLLFDGHSSHHSPATVWLAAENKIVLFVLPPHTTHIAQPLCEAVFFLSSLPGGRYAMIITLKIRGGW